MDEQPIPHRGWRGRLRHSHIVAQYGGPLRPITTSVPVSWITALDQAAVEQNISRADLTRSIIGNWVVEQTVRASQKDAEEGDPTP